jgi:ubiquinol-cytochrome c reductase cytochrome c subunit
MRNIILAVCVAAAFAIVPVHAQSNATPNAPGGAAAEHGHALFVAIGCYECHGTVGQGSRSAGPRLAPQPVPFEAFLQELRHPINDMPPYVAEVLSDADARDIHAYLESIPGPTHAVGDIPALNR